MKILFLNYEYPPLGGGAANATQYIFEEFSRFPEIEIELITSSIDKNYSQEKIRGNIVIHRLPIGKNSENLHYQSQKDLLIYSWKAFFFCRRLLKKKKFDLSHSFFTVPCGFLSFLFWKKYHLPYIVSLRGADVPGYSERFSFLYKIITPLIKKIWKESSFVIANSQGLKDLAKISAPDQKIGVIHNGVDIQEFQPKNKIGQDNIFRLVCISRLTQRKGIEYLIEAVSLLSEKYPDIKLILAGEGDAKKELEEKAQKLALKNKIEFLGRVPHEKVATIYATSDVFVLPSLNEGMSNTMLEALASGLPLIATDTGGTRELVSENENGFIVKMKDARDIAEKVEKLIQDPEQKELMSQKSRQKAEEMSWKKVAEKYFEFYEKTKTK